MLVDLVAIVLFVLLCSLRDRAQVEKLLRYIVEESPEDAEKKQSFKYYLPTDHLI